jgi:hypothetical protein
LLAARFEDREHLFLRVRSRCSDIFRTGFLQSMPVDGCRRTVTGLNRPNLHQTGSYGGTPWECQEMANRLNAGLSFWLE